MSAAKYLPPIFALLATATLSASEPPGDAERGRALYENHCTECHDRSVHQRETRKAASPAEVAAWVKRWSTHLELGWSSTDIADVRTFLVRRYYEFE